MSAGPELDVRAIVARAPQGSTRGGCPTANRVGSKPEEPAGGRRQCPQRHRYKQVLKNRDPAGLCTRDSTRPLAHPAGEPQSRGRRGKTDRSPRRGLTTGHANAAGAAVQRALRPLRTDTAN